VQTPIAFLSGGGSLKRRGCRPPGVDYTPRDTGIRFTQAVREAARAFYITVNNPKLDALIRERLTELGVAFKEHMIGNYHIFYGLSRKVEPEELGIYDAVTR
jgi:hypothetical protein